MNNPTQLIFPFQINQKASFKNFFCTSDNLHLINRLEDIVIENTGHEIMIHGENGCGKSFLMQAICNELSSKDRRFAFIPMKKAKNMGVEIFQNLASLNAVCIDDLQLIMSIGEWEQAMFHLINECQQSNCSLIISFGGDKALDEIVQLPDLLSRIKRMEFMTLRSVQDDHLNEALNFVSQQLDINLEQVELQFLLKHQTREFSILVENLLSLDQQAASLKRKITIPFIKETLNL